MNAHSSSRRPDRDSVAYLIRDASERGYDRFHEGERCNPGAVGSIHSNHGLGPRPAGAAIWPSLSLEKKSALAEASPWPA